MTNVNYNISLYVFVKSNDSLYGDNVDPNVFNTLKDSTINQIIKVLNKYNITEYSSFYEITISDHNQYNNLDNVMGLSVMIKTCLDKTTTLLPSFIDDIVNDVHNIFGIIVRKHHSSITVIQCSDNITDNERRLLINKWNTL